MAKDLGKIIQIVWRGLDVEFPRDVKLPAIYDALHVKNGDENLVLEVAQHLDEHTVRTIALSSTDGLSRGAEVVATGAPISVPVGAETQDGCLMLSVKRLTKTSTKGKNCTNSPPCSSAF